MSGFEVAGIILGALPLLIPAIENIRQSLSTRKYDQQLQSLVRNLKTEQVKLQNVCEKLLDGLVPPSQIQAMISQPVGDLWQDKETARKIRARLWDHDSYDAFETTTRSIQCSVDELAKRINAQRERQASLLKRSAFTLQRASYAETLSDIKDGVASLVTLTSQSVELEPSRRVRSQGRFLKILQSLSKSLYRAIQSSLAACHCYHGIGLRLETRNAVINPLDDEDEITRNLEFRITVCCDADTTIKPSWLDMLVKTVSPAETLTATHIESKMVIKSPPFLNKFKFKGKKSVSFNGSQSVTTISTSKTMTSTAIETSLIHSLPMSFPVVETSLSLCKKLQALRDQTQCHRDQIQTAQAYGMIVDAARKYAVYPAVSRTRSTVSLRQLIEGKGNPHYLSCTDRLKIAVIISSSVVQLHGSPWLLNTLSSRDIHFFVDNNGEVAISYDDPVLVQHAAAPATSTVTDGASTPAAFHRNPTLVFGLSLTRAFP